MRTLKGYIMESLLDDDMLSKMDGEVDRYHKWESLTNISKFKDFDKVVRSIIDIDKLPKINDYKKTNDISLYIGITTAPGVQDKIYKISFLKKSQNIPAYIIETTFGGKILIRSNRLESLKSFYRRHNPQSKLYELTPDLYWLYEMVQQNVNKEY